jgi:hypothetical protein
MVRQSFKKKENFIEPQNETLFEIPTGTRSENFAITHNQGRRIPQAANWSQGSHRKSEADNCLHSPWEHASWYLTSPQIVTQHFTTFTTEQK